MQKVAKVVRDSQLIESRSGTDTIKVWESHREQAALWRSIALMQIPTSFFLILFCMYLWGTRETILKVPARPLPGTYVAQDIPDTEFIEQATNFVNLIATYQPQVAKRQFEEAQKLLWEPALALFKQDMLGTELRAISSTSRTQIFYIDPTKTAIERNGQEIMVTFTGDRSKIIAGKEMPSVTTSYSVTMRVIPRNPTNPYGIVITDIKSINDKV